MSFEIEDKRTFTILLSSNGNTLDSVIANINFLSEVVNSIDCVI